MTAIEIMEQLTNGIHFLENEIKRLLADDSDMRNMVRDDVKFKELDKEIESKVHELSELVEMLELQSNREPIDDHDVIVVLYSEQIDRYESYKINNMDKNAVEGILIRLMNNHEDIWIGEEPVFLENHGAHLELIDKGKCSEAVRFYDFFYDREIGVVVKFTDLIPVIQIGYLLNRMEFCERLFSEEERNMISDYATRVEDKELVIALANEIAEEGYGVRHGGVSEVRASAIKKELEGFIVELSYYVSECMEFPTLGEYHEHLSLQEAIHLYQSIPAERMNGIKGIGIRLHVPGEEEYKDLNCDVIADGLIDMTAINAVEEFRTSKLIQTAIKKLTESLPGVEVIKNEEK